MIGSQEGKSMSKIKKTYDFDTDDYIVYPAHGVGHPHVPDKLDTRQFGNHNFLFLYPFYNLLLSQSCIGRYLVIDIPTSSNSSDFNKIQ